MTLRALFVAIPALCAAQSGFTQPMTAAAVIETAAEALGMVRGAVRRMDSINTVQFSGRGTLSVPEADGRWTSFEITDTTVGMSYFIPAMRWDMNRIGPNGNEQRTIRVVRGDQAWDERLPGVDPTPATDQAPRRLRQIWLTPHGIIRAAVEAEAAAPGSVLFTTQHGQPSLAVNIDGTLVSTTLSADYRPERVEMTIEHPLLGITLVEAIYADYVDWQKLDVFFPSSIVHRLGGETTLDMTVTAFFQNPYVVFPTPEQLSRSSQ